MANNPGAVLITGCSTGIGRATAERLAGKGLTVYATARRLESIEDLKAKGCKTLALDAAKEQLAAAQAGSDAVAARAALATLVTFGITGAAQPAAIADEAILSPAGIAAAGYAGTRGVLKVPPLEALREIA